jgi:uncharacterized membrane protein
MFARARQRLAREITAEAHPSLSSVDEDSCPTGPPGPAGSPRAIGAGGESPPASSGSPDGPRANRYPPPASPEPAWPAQLTVLAAIALEILLPERLTVGPRWLVPALEGALLLGLFIATPNLLMHEERLRRGAAIGLIALVSAANIYSLVALAHFLLHHNVTQGRELIGSGLLIWLTNFLIFGLWYWELDRGGPGKRASGHATDPDFLFPQMNDDLIQPLIWRPRFLDYLYVSLTNATAFSPTDTMPLSLAAKSAMGIQSLVSLVTIGLIISRAVNILA